MTQDLQSESTQGLLDLAVELSKNDITAGNEFTIFVLVKNPFSKPVWIQEVNVSLPSDLKRLDDKDSQQITKDVEAKQEIVAQERKKNREELQNSIDNLDKGVKDLVIQLKSSSEHDISSKLFWIENKMDELNKKADALELGESNVTIVGTADIGQIKIGSQLSKITLDNSFRDEDKQSAKKKIKVNQIEVLEPWLIHEQQALTRTVSLKSSLPPNSALLPGSTAVYTVILNVKRSLIFTPTKYRLQFYVNYSFEANATEQSKNLLSTASILTNTIAHLISIRPSVYSVITGSTIGGAIGAIARLLQAPATPSIPSIAVSLILSIILGGVAIIFMSRKSDTQSFVSVEDFWGGILIGFLVGYSGVSFFEGITGVTIPK